MKLALVGLICGTTLISLSTATRAHAEDSAVAPRPSDVLAAPPNEPALAAGSTHMHSPGLVAGGVALLVAGAGITGTGLAFLAASACGQTELFCLPELGRAVGGTLVGIGLGHMVAGVVLGGIGARKDPDNARRAAVGLDVSVGPQGVYLLGTF